MKLREIDHRAIRPIENAFHSRSVSVRLLLVILIVLWQPVTAQQPDPLHCQTRFLTAPEVIGNLVQMNLRRATRSTPIRGLGAIGLNIAAFQVPLVPGWW